MSKCCNKNQIDKDYKAILKDAGFNATATKIKIIEIFTKSKSPISSNELMIEVENVDESTIFRNLKQFSNAGLLNEVDLNEGFKRYELTPINHHHHHIKCNDCGRNDTIDLCELKAFSKQLKKIGYTNISHKFEFFGTCSSC